MKVFTLILQFYANLMGSGIEYTDKVLKETSLQNLFFIFINNQDLIFHVETTEAMSRLIKFLVEQKDFNDVEESDEEQEEDEEDSKTIDG